MTDKLLSWLTRWWDFIDQRGIVRRAVLGVAIWQNWQTFAWATQYAAKSTLPGLEVAAVIGAVCAPIAAFAGFVFKSYLDSKTT